MNFLKSKIDFFSEVFFHKYKLCIVWNWFSAKIILILQKCLFWSYSKWQLIKLSAANYVFYNPSQLGKFNHGIMASSRLEDVSLYNHHHHHHIALVARISLTLSHHSSLSFIALCRSSGQHRVSSHSCWMYVHAGRPAFARPCVGIHKSTSLMSSSLLLQQCPACLVRLTWIVFVIGGRWPYSWCLVGCCCQEGS